MIFSQDGIFSRAEQAVDKHGQAKARETLELALGEAQMQKHEQGLTDEQLTEKINAIGEELPKEKPEHPELQNVIVEGYIFEIDRSVPKIVDYIGPANGVIITAQITQNGDWQNPTATVKGTITKYGGGSVTNTTVTATNGVTIPANFPTTGGSFIIPNITTDTDITITASADDGKPAVTKVIKVRLVRDTTGPTLSEIDTSDSVGLTIKFKATATDSESGLKESTPLHYTISPATGLTTTSGDFNSGAAVEITSTAEVTYTITVTAEDKVGNKSAEKTATVTTVDGGVIKHIKTPTGLQEVNTKMIYGADVTGYTCTRKKDNGNELEWQIFYIDETKDEIGNITDSKVYLIAKDYMAPPTTETEMTKGTYSHTYYWNSTVLNKYKTIIPNTPFTQKFLADYANTSASEKISLQATNYMLDQTIWQEYMSTNGKSDYAFGGPTLPLFQASYNDTCKTAFKFEIHSSGNGYYMNQGEVSMGGFGDVNTQKGIYFKGDTGNPAYGIWLASPSYYDSNCLVRAYHNGRIAYDFYNYDNYLGFRPIVSLKPEVTFTDNGDGTYTIN